MKLAILQAVILSGGDTSDPVDVRRFKVISLKIPVLTLGDLTFLVSADGTSYQTLKKIGGTAVTVTAGTGDFSTEWIQELSSWPWIKIKSAATQAADRTFKVICK